MTGKHRYLINHSFRKTLEGWPKFSQVADLRDGKSPRATSASLFALLLLVGFGCAQQPASRPGDSATSEWVFNFTSTPLTIRSTGKKSYELSNQSSTKMQKYTLGCARLDAKKGPAIVHRMKPKEIEIEPGESWIALTIDGNPDRLTCEKMNSNLSVTDVVFENAVEWHAPANSQ